MTAALASISIDEALADPNLFGAAFPDLATWSTWRVVLKAAFGLPLSPTEMATFVAVAGDRKPPPGRVRELWAVVGRRGGKSRMASLIASYIAAFIDHRPHLSPGEVGMVLALAASKSQAGVVFEYARALFEASPLLAPLLEEATADELRLKDGVVIGAHANSFRTVRGRTLLAAIFDETAFWRDEASAQPDVETYRAVLPALATTNGMLVGISSPYAQRGLLYTKHQQAFGKDDPAILVVRAPTLMLNPTIDAKIIEDAQRDDPEAARAEWLAEFRGDLASLIDRAILEQCVDPGIRERPFVPRWRYCAFVDPSGGQHDSMTLGLAHREGERAVLDLAQEWKAPFSPADVVDDMVQALRRYRITRVIGDAYGGQWVREGFRKHGIAYAPSERNRSQIYLDALPLFTGRSAMLLDLPRLVSQIAQLERRTGATGKDAVDHMRGSADDLANSACGALVHAASMLTSRAHDDFAAMPEVNVGYADLKRRHLKSLRKPPSFGERP